MDELSTKLYFETDAEGNSECETPTHKKSVIVRPHGLLSGLEGGEYYLWELEAIVEEMRRKFNSGSR